MHASSLKGSALHNLSLDATLHAIMKGMRSHFGKTFQVWGEESGPLTSKPFDNLKNLLSRKEKERHREIAKEKRECVVSSQSEDDMALFLKAMEGVKPLHPVKKEDDLVSKIGQKNKKVLKFKEAEKEFVQKKLEALIKGEHPLPVKDTPEFVEGRNQNIHPVLCQRLHKGEFAVQAYCDLHGLNTLDALDVCEAFFAEAIKTRKKCVAVIHGRGLSSPRRPVLKEAVTRWLENGPYRRFVIAFSSAPHWDGGAGVTYVLLRNKPFKRRKKANRRLLVNGLGPCEKFSPSEVNW